MFFNLLNWDVKWKDVSYKPGQKSGIKSKIELKDGKGIPSIISVKIECKDE